jgi:hypothetical protein
LRCKSAGANNPLDSKSSQQHLNGYYGGDGDGHDNDDDGDGDGDGDSDGDGYACDDDYDDDGILL